MAGIASRVLILEKQHVKPSVSLRSLYDCCQRASQTCLTSRPSTSFRGQAGHRKWLSYNLTRIVTLVQAHHSLTHPPSLLTDIRSKDPRSFPPNNNLYKTTIRQDFLAQDTRGIMPSSQPKKGLHFMKLTIVCCASLSLLSAIPVEATVPAHQSSSLLQRRSLRKLLISILFLASLVTL